MATTLERNGPVGLLLDPFRPTREGINEVYRLTGPATMWRLPLLAGGILLAISLIGFFVDRANFLFAYLVAWSFCLTITLGALFFVMVHMVTRAQWTTVLRRIPESLAWGFPLLALLSIPILIGMGDLYHWTHVGSEHGGEMDEILLAKQPYLNVPFFLIRLALYFTIWTILAYQLNRWSIRQDVHPEVIIPAKMRKVSAIGIPIFAVTTAFASYDLIMSLDPHWFSTMFGVYIFSGAFWSAIAMVILVALFLQGRGFGLRRIITMEHYHDLGKWLFAFTVFWAYIAFSQYMLIWYSNLPEETVFYQHRLQHGWQYHSLVLLFGHFVLPFLVLLPRQAKRMTSVLAVMAIWALVMHWFDLHWLIIPVHREHGGFHWLDFATWLGVSGIYLGAFLYRLGRHSLVPQHDPTLGRSLAFQNV